MDSRKLVRIVAFAALLCFVLAVAVEIADAAAAEKPAVKTKGDASLAQKKGIAGSLGKKELDESKKPSPLQMGIGIGSVFVAFAVIKWL